MDFSQIILTPFSWLLTFFHDTLGDYGIALILFAVIVKIILFPFSMKGKRSMIQMNMIQGQLQKIQKQYANNREKMNEETQKLYAKEKINPMSGCLWSFVPLLILWPLYAIIRRPLYHLMGQSQAAIEAITSALNFTAEGGRNAAYSELYMASMIDAGNIESLREVVDGVSAGLGDKLFVMNFNFLGMDLSQIAEWKIWSVETLNWGVIGLFLLPIISAGLSVVMSMVSQKTNSMNNKDAGKTNSQMKTMMWIMPLMSLWIGYAMPAALCVYWIINNLLSIAQEYISALLLKKDYAKAAAEREAREKQEKEEEKRKKREAAERRAKAIEDAKNNKGKKKKPVVAENSEKKERTTDVGRIGMRPYARGRAYDPDRYGGVTEYKDPGAPIDEQAVAEALQAKGIIPEEEPVQAPTVEVTEQVENVSAETIPETVQEETPVEEQPQEEPAGEDVEEI